MDMQQQAQQEAGTTSGTQPGVAYGDTAKSLDNWKLLQEADALRGGGDPSTANRFVAVSRALQKPQEIRNRFIQDYGHQAAELLGEKKPDWGDAEHLYEEGKQSADYRDMRQSPSEYDAEQRNQFFAMMRRLGIGKERELAAQQRAEEMLSQLRQDDPSQYFSDLPFRVEGSNNPMNLGQEWQELLNPE